MPTYSVEDIEAMTCRFCGRGHLKCTTKCSDKLRKERGHKRRLKKFAAFIRNLEKTTP